MAIFRYWTLPMPVVAGPGATASLSSLLTTSFGAAPNGSNNFWIASYPQQQLTDWNFSYWNPSAPSVARWQVNGVDIGGGFDNQEYLSGQQLGSAVLRAGNDIGPFAYVAIPNAGPQGDYSGYIQYSLITVDPRLMSPVAGKGAPTPADIVASAYRFASFYKLPLNDNDCHHIASAVAAATGATFADATHFLDPTKNEEAGFWRIAYRGSDPNPTANWQTLVKPGDIVRMGWNGGGQHTITVLGKKTDGSIVVYDNTYGSVDGTRIGVHTVDYDDRTIATTVTIYRLTTDGFYLETGTSLGEALPGTIFDDRILGLGGNDTISGAGGNDLLVGGNGSDSLDGGAGVDTASYATSSAGVSVNLTTNVNSGGEAAGDRLVQIENLIGSAFADRLTGNAGSNVLTGGFGADVLAGGLGNDTYNLENGADAVSDSGGVDTITSTITRSLAGYATIENLVLLGAAAINGTGNSLANRITGNGAANILNGGDGNDVLTGGAGADRLIGGTGNDTYNLDSGTDAVSDSAGVDTITSTITRSLAGYATIENLVLLGTAAINGTGNSLANAITGNGAANLLDGGAGNDVLTGGAGADRLAGGAGNDTYNLENGTDAVSDSTGVDTITSTITRSLAGYATIENLVLLGAAAINGTGNGLANTITGNAAANILTGGAGADRLIGGAGNDTYNLDNGTDAVSDSAGVDTITSTITRSLAGYATVENLVLLGKAAINGTGNGLANTIIGNAAANILNGGAGNDVLCGGLGSDMLTGGASNDVFVFNAALGAANVDRITDFNVPADTIRLENAVFTKLTATGTLAEGMFWKSAAGLAHDADDRIIYETDTGKLFYDSNGSATGGSVHFATLAVNLPLTNADFVVI